MARIRTIKPEFPQSESMGRVSRDARLLFIQLWTLCDDSGRTRAASRMLASLLFPYDNDAGKLIDGWLEELEREECIVRYSVDGSTYLQILKWLNHQKIDKPSQSKIPPFDESSRILANPRERSSEDQGSRIKDQGKNIGDEYAADFVLFWESYPRKDNKAAAYRAWKKLTKPCRLLAAADVASRVWGDAKFVPHAATYLNNRRWEDSPAEPQSSSAVGYWK